MLKVGWFSTGTGKGSQALLTNFYSRILDESLQSSISFVFSNREVGDNAETDMFFELVNSYHLPLETLSHKRFLINSPMTQIQVFDRLAYDTEVMKAIAKYDVDLIVLAGYMLIVSGELSGKYKMINLHPALPDGPKGTWRQVIKNLIDNNRQLTGTMIHLVTSDVDRGPCISFSECDLSDLWSTYTTGVISKQKLFDQIRGRQFLQEPTLLINTISSIAEHKIDLSTLTYYGDGARLPLPMCIEISVEEGLR